MTSVQGVSRSAVGLIGVDIGGTFTDLVFYDGATSDPQGHQGPHHASLLGDWSLGSHRIRALECRVAGSVPLSPRDNGCAQHASAEDGRHGRHPRDRRVSRCARASPSGSASHERSPLGPAPAARAPQIAGRSEGAGALRRLGARASRPKRRPDGIRYLQSRGRGGHRRDLPSLLPQPRARTRSRDSVATVWICWRDSAVSQGERRVPASTSGRRPPSSMPTSVPSCLTICSVWGPDCTNSGSEANCW